MKANKQTEKNPQKMKQNQIWGWEFTGRANKKKCQTDMMHVILYFIHVCPTQEYRRKYTDVPFPNS